MDEKSGWQEDLRMFMHLPWKPFGVALWERHVGWPLRLMLLTLLLWGGQVCAASMGASGWYTVVANLGLALGMITLGLPHGAVDHLLQSGQLRKLPTAAMIAGYLGLGALMLGLWFWFPWWSLLFFVAYSAWHFGQADGRSWGLSAMASFAWGLSVLAYITGTHSEETSKIVEAMTHHASVWSLPTATMALWVGIGVVRQKSALVWTSLWLMIASQVPLMHAFGLYFIGQHSRTGWQDLKSGLQLNSRTLWKAALPFHAGAWLLLGLFYALPGIPSGFIREAQALAPLAIPQGWQGFGAEGTFFVFLACLSFPHVVTMHRFYRFGEGPKAQNMNQR
jgi:Brp/Blh family beta-carotene 15,15'-monooxygenase